MGVTVEVYLRDQVIRGELPDGQGRPLDQLNNARENYIILGNALSGSLHVDAPPMKLGTVRVQRDQILLVVPHDAPSMVAPRLRSGWVEKRRARVIVGLGPLAVTGSLHMGQWEGTTEVTVEQIARSSDARAFLPATQATVASQYDPNWSIESGSVFLARAAIGYVCLLSPPAELTANSEASSIEAIYRRFGGTG